MGIFHQNSHPVFTKISTKVHPACIQNWLKRIYAKNLQMFGKNSIEPYTMAVFQLVSSSFLFLSLAAL